MSTYNYAGAFKTVLGRLINGHTRIVDHGWLVSGRLVKRTIRQEDRWWKTHLLTNQWGCSWNICINRWCCIMFIV